MSNFYNAIKPHLLKTILILSFLTIHQINAEAGIFSWLKKNLAFSTYSGQENYQDQFSTAAYSNNDGTQNWTGDWIEVKNGGTATDPDGVGAGNIQIVGNQLRFEGIGGADPYLYRQLNLSSATSATLSFDISTSGNLEEAGQTNPDEFQVQISSNGGGTWTVLENFIGDLTATRTYDISAYAAANTQLRFNTALYVNDGGEYFFIDNIGIEYTVPGPGAGNCVNTNELGGTVFNDANNNGICELGESRVDNVTVTLFDDNGQVSFYWINNWRNIPS